MIRTFDTTFALTNSPVTVSVTFSNTSPTALRGFFYTDQIPSALSVTPVSVRIGGIQVTNYIFEEGFADDVFSGCVPYRWILEQPTNFTEANPVPAASQVQIVYAVRSMVAGTFDLSQFSWTGFDPAATNACFGFSEPADQRTLTFAVSDDHAILSGRIFSNDFVLQLAGVPGHSYAVEVSSNLVFWSSVVTNVSPFSLTNTASSARSFYRARWLP